jgi:hypothetical protein
LARLLRDGLSELAAIKGVSMSRSLLTCLLFVSLPAALACDPLPGWDVDSGDCQEPTLQEYADPAVRGSMDHSTLASLCEEDTCNEQRPLAVGADHDVTFYVDDAVRLHDYEGDYTVESEDPGVVRLERPSSSSVFDGEEYDDGVCVDHTTLSVSATLNPVAAGTAHLTLKRKGKVIDRFTVVVAEAARVQISAQSYGQNVSDVTASGLTVTAKDDELKLEEQVFDAQGRELVIAGDHVTWVSGDASVIAFSGVNEQGYYSSTSYDELADGRDVMTLMRFVGISEVQVDSPWAHVSFAVAVTEIPKSPL